MKKLFLIFVLLLAGCNNDSVIYPHDFKQADAICAANGGTDKYRLQTSASDYMYSVQVTCNNGVVYSYRTPTWEAWDNSGVKKSYGGSTREKIQLLKQEGSHE